MSIIPNVRTDEGYNQSKLDEIDKEFVAGFDWVVEEVAENFFYNLELYEDDLEVETSDFNVVTLIGKHEEMRDALIEAFKHYAEMERNQLVVSMLENEEKYPVNWDE